MQQVTVIGIQMKNHQQTTCMLAKTATGPNKEAKQIRSNKKPAISKMGATERLRILRAPLQIYSSLGSSSPGPRCTSL